MRRYSRAVRLHADGKSLTDFLTDRHVMEAADLDATLLCGISHEESNRSVTETNETVPALSAGGHKTGFQDFPGAGVSQTGRGEIRPDLCRAIWDNRMDREPVSLGEHCDLTRLRFGGKTRQRYHRSSEEREYRKR
jgi:hypothetical protein